MDSITKNNQLLIIDRKMQVYKNHQPLIDKLIRNGRSFMVRETPFMTSVVYDGRENVFTKRNPLFPNNQLWIFRSVNISAEKLAKQIISGEVEFVIPERHDTNVTNLSYDDSVGTITGTDVESAYWTIAHQMGVISTKTFERAGAAIYKVTRLAALAILGRTMVFKKYKDGIPEKEPEILHGNKLIMDFYKAIRYRCYEHMQTLAGILGDDFEAYRTDCIYYRDTPENRQKVYAYLDGFNFRYKQLVFEDGIIQESNEEIVHKELGDEL